MTNLYKFEQNNNNLLIQIFDKKGKLPDYIIHKDELSLISTNGVGLSYWIEHMSGKNQMTYNGLYMLAQEIRKYCPDSNINWEETFTFIEEQKYLSQRGNLNEPINNPKTKTSLDLALSSLNSLKLIMQLRSEEEFTKTIKETVNKKLIEYGIKTKS